MSKFQSFIVVVLLGAFAFGILSFVLAVTLWIWNACLTMEHQRISNVSGFDFEISETDCDLVAKDAAISVFISKAGQSKKTLLFKYVPPGYGTLPSITAIDDHTIKISIWRVPVIFCRKEKWQTLTIEYAIGVIDYPSSRGEPDC